MGADKAKLKKVEKSREAKKNAPRQGAKAACKLAPVVRVRHESRGRTLGQTNPSGRAELVQRYKFHRGQNKALAHWTICRMVSKEKGVTRIIVDKWVKRDQAGQGFDDRKRTGRPPIKLTKKEFEDFCRDAEEKIHRVHGRSPFRHGKGHGTEPRRLIL